VNCEPYGTKWTTRVHKYWVANQKKDGTFFKRTWFATMYPVVLCLSAGLVVGQTPVVEWAVNVVNGSGAWGTAVTLDKGGNIYVTGNAGYTALLGAKFGPDGKLLWIKPAGGDGVVVGRGIGVDNGGNVYITGYCNNSTFAMFDSFRIDTTIGGGFLVKLDNSGNVLWVVQPTGDGDSPLRLAVDLTGNSYVTGEFFPGTTDFGGIALTSSGYAGFVAKYDPSGQLLWASQADRAGEDIAIDSSGNCYVAGKGLTKYDSTGNQIWNVSSIPSTYGGNGGPSLAVDAQGHSFVPGISVYAPNPSTSINKYDTHGNLLWSVLTTNIGTGINFDPFGPGRIAVDGMGNTYVTADPYLCAKFDGAGRLLWVTNAARYSSSNFGKDIQYGITTDNAGNCFVTGTFVGLVRFGSTVLNSGGGEGIYLAKISDPPPSLIISNAGPGVSLSWSISAASFVLESATSLNPPNWQAASESAGTNGTQLVVTAAINGASRYFRLRKP